MKRTDREIGPFRWYLVALSAALLDQIGKAIVVSRMAFGESISITEFFNLVHARNTGAAFSFLADAGGWQRYFLTAIALVISAWIVLMLRRRPPMVEAVGLALVLGGALGNVVDRVARGHVVDYLDFYWGVMHWPAFNLADTFITTGVVLLLFGMGRSSGSDLRPSRTRT